MKASDLMKKLENDSDYQAMRKRKDQELAELQRVLSEDEKILVEEINSLGYEINSVWDFVNNNSRYEFLRKFNGNYADAYPILVKHLSIKHHPRIIEGIIRALTEKNANGIAAEPLLSAFYKESNPHLKWVLSNSLRTVLTPAQKRKHPEYKDIFSGKV